MQTLFTSPYPKSQRLPCLNVDKARGFRLRVRVNADKVLYNARLLAGDLEERNFLECCPLRQFSLLSTLSALVIGAADSPGTYPMVELLLPLLNAFEEAIQDGKYPPEGECSRPALWFTSRG